MALRLRARKRPVEAIARLPLLRVGKLATLDLKREIERKRRRNRRFAHVNTATTTMATSAAMNTARIAALS
jgi:hypothetical protein